MNHVLGLGLRCSPPTLSALGFTVSLQPGRAPPSVLLTNIRIVLGVAKAPALFLSSTSPLPDTLAGVPCFALPIPSEEEAAPPHPNGVARCERLTLRTPDWISTSAALEARGWREVVMKQDSWPGLASKQARVEGVRRSTFQVGLPGQELVLELEGPAVPSSSGPATLWGVTLEASRGLHKVAHSLGHDCELSRQGQNSNL